NSQVTPEDCRLMKADPSSGVAFHFVAEGRMRLLLDGAEPDEAPENSGVRRTRNDHHGLRSGPGPPPVSAEEHLELEADDGRRRPMLDGAAPIEVPENSVVLLTRNAHHVLGSGPGLRPITPEEHLEVDADSGIMRICYGGGGERTRIVCGFVGTEVQRHPLADALPPVLVLPTRDEPRCHWIATSFRYAPRSIGSMRPGAATALARLSELMFIEAVRNYVDALPEGERGWLGGLRDPVVGRALMLMHSRIDHPWTTSELAQ